MSRLLSKPRPTFISGLAKFGISHSELHLLGMRPVTVEIVIGMPPYIYPSQSELRSLLQMTPPERRTLVRQWRRHKYSALRKELPVGNVEVMKLNMAPVGVRLTLPARSIERLRRLRNVGSISVCSIKGVRAKNYTQTRTRLYAVTGRMAFQVEGQTRGTQLCEERITIVTARSEHVARARVARIMNAESFPYLSISGHFVRWGFEGIIDVCECPDEQLSSRSTEVFYRYKKRRVNAENEWQPRTDK